MKSWSNPLEPRVHSRLSNADRVALIAAGGVVLACLVWVGLAWVEAFVGAGGSLKAQLLYPDPANATTRLATMALILTSTLALQSLYARHLRLEDLLDMERERTLQIYDHSPEAIVCVGKDRHVVYANPAARSLEPALSHGADVGDLCSQRREDDAICQECGLTHALEAGEVCERTMREQGSDGSERWIEQTVYPILDEHRKVNAAVAIMRDVSERARAQQLIRRMAFHDALTGLPNRLLFADRLDNALLQAKRRAEWVAVVFLDINDFKAINDTFGHAVGDSVLCAVGERLVGLLRAEDTVARHSGDEFTILARVDGQVGVETLIRRLTGALEDTVHADGHDIAVSASMGVALCPGDGTDSASLIKNADTAMYHAKEWGHSSWARYEPAMSAEMSDRFELESALRLALDRDEFELFYQPQIDVRSGRVAGVEALIRWNHPTQGMLGPHVFIPLAERSGLIDRIGRWVLHTACRQMSEWLDEGLDVSRVAVNLSAREFMQPEVVSNVRQALAAAGLEPHRLEIEITETTAMHGMQRVLLNLKDLRDLGVRIAIDDFGTGYSAMSYLRRFPLDTLKIAQVFMRDAHVDPQSAAIASMIVDLARELELDVVAEGVELPSQLEFLDQIGCHIAQGYLFARPCSAHDFAVSLRDGFGHQLAQEATVG